MGKDRKKFKDTKMGALLATAAPGLLSVAGNALPDAGVLGMIGKMLSRDPNVPESIKLEFERLRLEHEIDAQTQVTRRWEADMRSSSKLSANIRPIVLIAVTTAVLLFGALDATSAVEFDMPPEWISLLTTISTTVFAAYFAGRSWEKIKTL